MRRLRKIFAVILTLIICTSLCAFSVRAEGTPGMNEEEYSEEEVISEKESGEAELEDEQTNDEDISEEEICSEFEDEDTSETDSEDEISSEEKALFPEDGLIIEGESDILPTGGHTRAEAVAWANAQIGSTYDYGFGYQCVALVAAYYEYLGQTSPRGDAKEYLTPGRNRKPDGWNMINGVNGIQPGDIAVWTGGRDGHVAIVVAVNSNYCDVIEQNQDGNGGIRTDGSKGKKGKMYFSGISGYVQPDFPGGSASGQEMTSGYDRLLPDGDYIIASTGSRDRTKLLYLDIQGAAYPAADPTNVSICYTDNPLTLAEYEVWTIKYKNGFYTITQKGTNMALDVQDYSRECGANVLVSTLHSKSNQQWAISRNERNGYRIQAKNSGYSLDVAGAVFYNGTNVRMWTGNNEDAQSWIFVPYKPLQPVKSGKYMLVSALNNNYIMDVSGETGDIPNCQNVQLWQDNTQNKYNEFEVVPLSNGYYKLVHVASGKALEVTEGISNIRANIALYDDNGSIAQQWAIIPNGSGYMLVSRCSGMAADVQDGIVSNGTNINLCYRNNSDAETWKFVDGEYLIGYNMNGGTGSIASQTKYYKNAIKLTTTVPKRDGMVFLGWSTDRFAKNAEYASGATYSKDESIILYAVWKITKVTSVFKDVPDGAWFVDAVQYVYDKGYMAGTGEDTFSPNSKLTRAQFVTVLYSVEGKPNVSYNSAFSDVKSSDYFAKSVSWASAKGITSGTGNGKFSPHSNITREQLALMLYKYASMKKYNLTIYSRALNEFSDADRVSGYATEAMKWAVTQEIIAGKGGRLDPQGVATRAECAAMIKKLQEKNNK